MKNIVTFLILFLLIPFSLFSQEERNIGTIIIVIENIKHSEGQIIASLHNIEEKNEFPEKDYTKTYKWSKVKIENNKALIAFSRLPLGIYAISVFHDEDSNDKLNTNFLGIPNEGYGFSNNPRLLFGPPSFDKAKIELKAEKLNIHIEMKY